MVIPHRLASGGALIKDAFNHESPKLHYNCAA